MLYNVSNDIVTNNINSDNKVDAKNVTIKYCILPKTIFNKIKHYIFFSWYFSPTSFVKLKWLKQIVFLQPSSQPKTRVYLIYIVWKIETKSLSWSFILKTQSCWIILLKLLFRNCLSVKESISLGKCFTIVKLSCLKLIRD